jgi:hypothetical protein
VAKAPIEIRSLARKHTQAAIDTLEEIMKDKQCPPAARAASAVALMDRGWGKPHQTSDVTVRQAVAKDLSDNELADIATGSGEGAAEPSIDPSQLN